MALTTAEVESLRYHLGYGNINVGAYPYTPDGFKELFDDVISPNLTTGTETTSTTAVVAKSTAAITVAAIGDIVANSQIVVDVGEQAEVTTVKAVSGTSVTAYFVKAHASSGYPVALMSGVARLRLLIADADRAWMSLTGQSVAATAGLKSVDKGDVEWFQGNGALKGRADHYMSVVGMISSLVRVAPAWATGRGQVTLESY